LVNLDRFSKYLKYLRNFKKLSKLTKTLDLFARGERATLFHQFEQRQYFNRANFSGNICTSIFERCGSQFSQLPAVKKPQFLVQVEKLSALLIS
jgi:hypothetical protein